MALSRLAIIVAGSLLVASGTVWADEDMDQDERAVKTRQSVFYLLGYYISPLAGMARGLVPFDADTVATGSARIADLAPMIPETFRRDTRGADVKTEALDPIWDNLDDFSAKASALAEKAGELNAIAASGTEAEVKAAIGAMGQACGNCHDEYREDDD
jgi:cytochrome c556